MGKTTKINDPSYKRRGKVYMNSGKKKAANPSGGNAFKNGTAPGLAKVKGSGVDYTLLLTCDFILTEKMYERYAKLAFWSLHKKWSRKVLLAAIITIGVGIGILFIPHAVRWLGGLVILAGLYLLYMSFFGYRMTAKTSYGNLQDFYGEVIKMRVEFYPQFFRVATEKGQSDFPYAQIIKRLENDEMGVLIAKGEGMIEHGQIIYKEVFTPEQLSKYYEILDGIDF